MYRDRNIDSGKFREWIEGWQWDGHRLLKIIDEKGISKKAQQLLLKTTMTQVNGIKECVDVVKENELLYEAVLGLSTPLIFYKYFKYDSSSIKVANYYEVFLYPSDLRTKKKLIKGFDMEHKEIGEIKIRVGNEIIGVIGNKSDLMWTVFYDDFIVKQYGTVPTHTHDHENYLSLQLWNIDTINDEEIESYVQEILYNCSIKLGLNLRKMKVDKLNREKGQANQYELDFNYKSMEILPLMYYNATLDDVTNRVRFLNYYQVIEFYYVRANNLQLQENLIKAKICDLNNVNFKEVMNSIKRYKKDSLEKEAIKLVLGKTMLEDDLKAWLNEDITRTNWFTNNVDSILESFNIDLSKGNDKIIQKISDRIYSVRCSIVHSKGDIEEVAIVPNLNDSILENELSLVQFLAQKVLEFWNKG